MRGSIRRHRGAERPRRLAGKRIIEEQTRGQVRTFLDELRNGTTNYRTVASLGDQVAQEYRGRAVLELLQNAHDVLGGNDDPGQVSFVLNSSGEQPELLIANSGRPFRHEDFSGICELAQSPKDPNESVGNKGLGFRSVLELTTCPEVWSTAPAGDQPAFTFGFHPRVLDSVVRVAAALVDGRPATDPALGGEPVVDWSEKQIEEYRGRISGYGIKPAEQVEEWLSEEVKQLSPYVLPRPLGDPPPSVTKLLEDAHATVIRLPLDGGRAGSAKEAVKSVREQLVALNEAAMVFLRHLSALRITIDGDRTELKRWADSEHSVPVSANRHDRLRVSRSPVGADDVAHRSFHVWSRTFGGTDQPAELARVAAAVRHLPNRWPEVRKVEVAVAVEDTPKARKGAFVIFLPTRMETGVGAHVNAPFYGSLDRRKIDFGDDYNQLLLELVTDLALDAVLELVNGPAEPWRGRAVIDLLAQAGSATPDDPKLTRRLRECARDRQDYPCLDEMALILCDGGWRRPVVARTMPNIPSDDPLGEEEWREQAGFAVASSALDERRDAVKALLGALDRSPDPTDWEWADTLQRMAERVRRRQADAQADRSHPSDVPPSWNMFLGSVLAVLPPKLRSEPRKPRADALAGARFLPTEDGRLLSASGPASTGGRSITDPDAVRIFFQPRSGADDAADFVGSVPDSLKERMAFLHRDVETHEGPRHRRTDIQKFLDGRFVQSFRRADLLRVVIVPSLLDLPVAHGGPEAAKCVDALAWSLELVGPEEPAGLLNDLAKLPVACTDGWFAMKEAVFGPGWAGRSGDHVKTLADGLPGDEGEELLRSALLPPDDHRWFPQGGNCGPDGRHLDRIDLANRSDQFARAGVVDGLRLEACKPIRYRMSRSDPKLPKHAPEGILQSAWDHWRETVLERIKPHHWNDFEYELGGVNGLPMLHCGDLSGPARSALSNLILASLVHWNSGWDEITITKTEGHQWSQRIKSPIKHWLSTLPWLVDDSKTHASRQDPKPLRQRWFVPESLLRGQGGRFRHLSPLPLPLARRLAADDELLRALRTVGLNVYPTEDDSTGPALLEVLVSVVENGGPMPAGGFDVLIGQIHHAWQHLGEDRDLPKRFLVRTKPRTLAIRTAEGLNDTYLPDDLASTRSLREQREPILAVRRDEAQGWVGDRLHELGATPASALKDRCLIDGHSDGQPAEGAQTMDEVGLNWLPVVLLALAAHGGGKPTGPTTRAWRRAVQRLGRARVRLCRSIRVELLDGERIVAGSDARAHWLPRPAILLLHHEITQRGLWEEIAAASQAVLDRQDLLKDLRLVLGSLAVNRTPTRPTWQQVKAALNRAEIDAEELSDIQLRWIGETTMLLDRLRPLAKLLKLDDTILGADRKDTDRLTEWLAGGFRDRPRHEDPMAAAERLLDAARECYDDAEMGMRVYEVIGEDAQLSKWNDALRALGGQYEQVANAQAETQAKRHLDEAARLLRAFARHVAMADDGVPIEDQGKRFSMINDVHESLDNGAEWSRRCAKWSDSHWRVPFAAVLGVLLARYRAIPSAKRYLDVLQHVRTVDELRLALEREEVTLDPDPREVARGNQRRLDKVVGRVRRLYEAWVEKEGSEPTSSPKALDIRLDDSTYLRDWPASELFELAKRVVDDSGFHDKVAGCTTSEAMHERLGIPFRGGRGDERKKRPPRMIDVAGEPEPVDGTDEDYRDIFERLKDLPELPAGPDILRDELTALRDIPPNGGHPKPPRKGGEVGLRVPKTADLHDSPHTLECVGIIGEMQAYRFLKAKFGIEESAWVSGFRARIVPLLDGEKDVVSDSHGYDFRFTHEGTTWCVEVKATTGNKTSFDLPLSELNAANRIASRKDERWRILRVRQALTAKPECDWLPNPFEPGSGERLTLREGSMTVEYALSETSKPDRSAVDTPPSGPGEQ